MTKILHHSISPRIFLVIFLYTWHPRVPKKKKERQSPRWARHRHCLGRHGSHGGWETAARPKSYNSYHTAHTDTHQLSSRRDQQCISPRRCPWFHRLKKRLPMRFLCRLAFVGLRDKTHRRARNVFPVELYSHRWAVFPPLSCLLPVELSSPRWAVFSPLSCLLPVELYSLPGWTGFLPGWTVYFIRKSIPENWSGVQQLAAKTFTGTKSPHDKTPAYVCTQCLRTVYVYNGSLSKPLLIWWIWCECHVSCPSWEKEESSRHGVMKCATRCSMWKYR